MDLKNYIDALERGEAKKLATALGVSSSFLSQMASGRSPISPARCVEIEQATNKAVTRKEMRPDDWERIWPELSAS
ncbi:transcriptional regulator [Pantoea ananatis]|uniref:transcriptional regulator n=1 Tax=Pantoea ananas TaxID=553 RepID=UPI001B307E6E|nr:YdaS family helix-turn-helix protein [Pantoea ananatis]